MAHTNVCAIMLFTHKPISLYDEVKDYKNQLRTTLLFSTFVAMVAMFIFRAFIQDFPASNFIHLPISASFLLVTYAVWRKYGTYKPFDWFVLTYAYTFQVGISYVLGSYASAQLFWSFPFVLGMFLLFGIRSAIIYMVYFCSTQAALFYFDPLNLDPAYAQRGVIHLIAMTFVIYVLFIQQKIFGVYRKYKEERDKNSYDVEG